MSREIAGEHPSRWGSLGGDEKIPTNFTTVERHVKLPVRCPYLARMTSRIETQSSFGFFNARRSAKRAKKPLPLEFEHIG